MAINEQMREQRLDEAIGVSRTIEGAAPFIEADPSVLDLFKATETVRHLAEIHGVPASVMRTDKELEALSARRDREQQEATVMANLPDAAKAARDLAEAEAARAKVA